MTPPSYTSTDGFPELHMSRIINADFETTASRLFRWGVQRSGLFLSLIHISEPTRPY